MARVNPRMVLADAVDAQSFETLASTYGVSSVPLTVLNKGLKIVGAVPEERMMDAVRRSLGR